MKRFRLQRCAPLVALVTVLAAPALGRAPGAAADFAVAPQYDTTHVYVDATDFDRLVHALVATFGGTTTPRVHVQITPTSSKAYSQLALTFAGTVSVIGFTTPIPAPFGGERTGYLLSDFARGIAAMRHAGADIIVAPFTDPVGRDVVVVWPGGVSMQFYVHRTAPSYPPLRTFPENRVYVSPGSAEKFVRAWTAFSGARVISDDAAASGAEIGSPATTVRRIRTTSRFGLLTLFVTDGHLNWPYGRELTGFEVLDLDQTLARATSEGATVLVPPYGFKGRRAAMVMFPGGYVAEIHSGRR